MDKRVAIMPDYLCFNYYEFLIVANTGTHGLNFACLTYLRRVIMSTVA